MGTVLLVGPDRDRAAGLRSLLREDGHVVRWLRSLDQWRDAERAERPEVIVAAVAAVDALLGVRGSRPHGFAAPLLFVRNESDPGLREVHLDDRLVDSLSSPFMREELLARVDALMRVRRVVLRSDLDAHPATAESDNASGGALAGIAARIASVLGTRLPRHTKPLTPYLEVAARVAEWADRRDGIEEGHAERVATYCGMMADGIGLPDSEANPLLRAAMLHDIGKVALPVEILRQEGPLGNDQMRLVKTHAERGSALLRALDSDEVVADAILYHHERVDGSGYHGKTASQTPLASRILAIAEAFDAMTRSRFREPVSADQALSRLEDLKGSAFDPVCVDALTSALRPRPREVPLSVTTRLSP